MNLPKHPPSLLAAVLVTAFLSVSLSIQPNLWEAFRSSCTQGLLNAFSKSLYTMLLEINANLYNYYYSEINPSVTRWLLITRAVYLSDPKFTERASFQEPADSRQLWMSFLRAYPDRLPGLQCRATVFKMQSQYESCEFQPLGRKVWAGDHL